MSNINDELPPFALDEELPYATEPAVFDTADILEAAALDFHRRNPHILREIARVCLRVFRAGRDHWSMKAAFEVVRYNATVTTDHRTYKLNNNHTAFYARWIMRDFPELDGFFQLRSHPRVHQEYFE
jgi:hypothetical protein